MVQPDKAVARAECPGRSNGEGAGPRDCPVCMEPAPEWVAVGPCGHREVCVSCAVRMRFVERDNLCCICRALCPTVVITKQNAGGQQQQFPKPPLAAGGAGQAGRPLLYHSGMAAYFDDQGQYEKVRKMCLLMESAAAPSYYVNGQVSPRCAMFLFLLNQVVTTLIGLGTGVPIAMHLYPTWHQRIPVVLASGFVAGLFAYVAWKLAEWITNDA